MSATESTPSPEVPPLSSAQDQARPAPAASAALPSGQRRRSHAERLSRRRPPITELHLRLPDRILFYLMVAVVHIASLIPDFILYPLGVAGGWLGYILDRRHVRIGMRNLALAFPDRDEAERRRILRASYLNLGRSGAEYVRLGGFFYRRLKRRVSYRNFSYWKTVQERHGRKGIIVLTAHFGNFELLPAAHAMYGYQISLVHHTQRFLAGDALMTFVRERAGITIVRKHAAARAVLRALRNNDTVGIPFDQNAKRSEAIFVPFFSELAATSSGLARLVALSGATVVPVFIVRQPDGRSHRIEIHEEVEVQRSGDSAADLEENTRRFVKAIEDAVRDHPEQFLWTHRRYRTRPRGTPPIYDV